MSLAFWAARCLERPHVRMEPPPAQGDLDVLTEIPMDVSNPAPKFNHLADPRSPKTAAAIGAVPACL